MISIPLYLTQEHACSYLDNQAAQTLFVDPAYTITTRQYAELIKQGFRRSGDEVYAPHCANCFACVPARLAVADFIPNRNQKRCLKKNSHTQALIKPAIFYEDHYLMYLRYQEDRHKDGGMVDFTPEEYIHFLSSLWCDTRFVEFSIGNELAAVAVIDQFDNAWSAVYTFFEPKFSNYSLGTYAVLWEIEQSRLEQREFLYLGFWIKNCQKMTYKSEYQPLQLLIDGQWNCQVPYNKSD
ncbi:MAG: arginyltransferase [Methylococcaceae bacterium]|nr:arginyltransferase [Methylococcaceae bacterium]